MPYSVRHTILLFLALVVVCLPRFNRNDRLLGGIPGRAGDNDSAHYVAMTEVYRGDRPVLSPEAPFTYRPLVPFVASLLPLNPW